MTKVFVIQDIWTQHAEKYCDECEYKQTHISFVPYGEGLTELRDESCVLLNDPSLPVTWCAGYDDWKRAEEDE